MHRIEVPRSARYYTAGGEGELREVWVVLHGFGMLAAKFLRWFSPIATPARLVVAPEALNHYYTNHETRKVGATWMTSEDRETEIADYVRYLDLVLDHVGAGLIRPLQSRPEQVGAGLIRPLQSLRVEVHGFSQGSATASRWVMLGRVRPARLVLWAGGVPPDPDLATNRDRLSNANLTIVLGDRNQYVSEDKIGAESARLEAAGVRFTLRRFSGGHVIPWPLLEELASTTNDERPTTND